ncbi:hypothetical protein ABIA30_004384 [Mycobacterium sp. MAA66]|uniref:hypothetical protein n=1 Tax=Mycobacterium sp. MAA66 TaxID=3156297 RepID=UPI0035147E51
MSKLSGAIAALAVCTTVPTALAAPASAAQTHRMTLFANMRSCSFQQVEYAKFAGMTSPLAAEITSDGHTAVARVDMTAGTVNAQYIVRLIPAPYAALGCGTGDPGITSSALNTDEMGVGSTTLQTAIAPGTTGMWIAVDRPSAHSQAPREFYSTNFIAAV